MMKKNTNTLELRLDLRIYEKITCVPSNILYLFVIKLCVWHFSLNLLNQQLLID